MTATSLLVASTERRTLGPRGAWRAGLFEQVGENLVNLDVVDVHQGKVRWDLDVEDQPVEQPAQPLGHITQQLVDRHRLAIREEGAGLDAAQAEEVRHDAVQPLRLVADQSQQLERTGAS